MPNIDLSLEKLKKYKGISPIPLDMEEFWKKAIKELENANAKLEISPAEFSTPICDCYNLVFKSIDGKNIYSKMMIPKNIKKNVPAVVEFHGYGGSSGDWCNRLSFPASGIAYFGMDCRDQMGNSGDEFFRTGNLLRGLRNGVNKCYYKKVYLDALKLLSFIFKMDNIDINRVATLGYSQGGALALVSSALDKRVNKVFSVYPYLSDFKRVWDMDLGGFAYQELKDYFKWYDPQHIYEKEMFEKLSYIDVKNFASYIQSDVTMVTGLIDTICPASTQFAIYNNIKSKKHHLIYPDFGHENINGLEDIIYKWALTLLK